jgi:phage terminase large subunit
MSNWQQKSKLLAEKFVWTKTRIFAKDHPETWWMSARTWSKSGDRAQQANTLAGLHAKYIMFVIDESGGVPDAVMASAEAALSTCEEGHLIQGGNPTHLEGPLYKACTSERSLWNVFTMTGDPNDPNRSALVDVKWAQDQIDKYGKDSPWVMVNVFGVFPPASFNALIGPDEINEAVKRSYREQDYRNAPRILGIDVARTGADSSIIFPRQGLQAFNPLQFRNIDGTEGAERTIRKWNEWQADGVFIDNTGGFGASWIDNLLRLGKDPIGVHFSQSSTNPQYFNKRAEMAFLLVDWIKRGGAIPDIPELTKALTVTTYSFKGEQLLIEPKEDVKAKMDGNSPDHMDALMLTFAMPVEKIDRSPYVNMNQTGAHNIEYNPFSRERVLGYQ